MPSWYNLFFAVWGAAALARYVETNHVRWLVAAGFCGGLSILFKITGLYFIAAGLLWLTYREQLLSERDQPEHPGWYSRLACCGLAAFACLGLAFLRAGRVEMNALHFTAPLAGLAGLLLYRERRWPHGASSVRWRRFVGMAAPFGLGAAIPLAALVGYYASQHALGDLYAGLFVLPRMRVESGVYPLPGVDALMLALPLAALAAIGMQPLAAPRRSLESAIIACLIFLLMASGTQVGFNLSFFALRNSLPLLIAVAAWMLLDQRRLPMTDAQRQLLFLATAVAALGGLVQYPHAYGIYFFYAAPLAALLVAYVVALQPSPPRRAWAGLLAFYLAFAIVRLNGPDPHRNVGWAPARPVEPLGLERCNLTIPAEEANVYRRLTALVQRHSAPGSFILAGPDSPEVYFLSQRRNPSRVMYEFFRPDWLASREQLIDLLEENDVAVAVVNCRPGFSPPLSAERIADLKSIFPHEETVAQHVPGAGGAIDRFRVFWRKLPRTTSKSKTAPFRNS